MTDNELPETVKLVIGDGYNAKSVDENPYVNGDWHDAVGRAAWNRGYWAKVDGHSLAYAQDISNRIFK